MSGSQVFYMGDNGEVLTWDGRLPDPIKPGVPFCATVDDSLDAPDPAYLRGYERAMNDVLIEIVRAGKGHLVQWIEARLKDLL